MKLSLNALFLLTAFNVILLSLSIYFFISSSSDYRVSNIGSIYKNNTSQLVSGKYGKIEQLEHKYNVSSIVSTDLLISIEKIDNWACDDPVWCSIPIPNISFFKFDPPTDQKRWRKAQIQASKGEQVLLRHVQKAFPNHLDFLDGDISFRSLHFLFDFFLDEKRDLSPLVPISSRRLDSPLITAPKVINGKYLYPWEANKKRVIPDPYDFRSVNRSAIVAIGYTAFTRDSQTYFTGNRVGGAFIDRSKFFSYWKSVKSHIDLPFIAICSLNENWGFLSTKFPNRTAGWGRCCDQPKDKDVLDYLNHEKTLMLMTNQHHNLSHPKLIILPRGIPLTWGRTRLMIWDAMRLNKDSPKEHLLFAAASKWGPRPQILQCISRKFTVVDFQGHVNGTVGNRLSREMYYRKLGVSMFGLGLPGLGYDCFRNWELMTMGSIVILEKSVGLDRTMWRLPALFVEDFDEITPKLLRTAYLEALYRAPDFEYQRLTQSFWWSFIMNVSATKSVQTILDTFPMEAEDTGLKRPREPYECGKTGTCGAGTMRTPKSSC